MTDVQHLADLIEGLHGPSLLGDRPRQLSQWFGNATLARVANYLRRDIDVSSRAYSSDAKVIRVPSAWKNTVTHEPAKAIGGSCLGGLVGAVLGIVIGGFVGAVIAPSNNDIGKNSHPLAEVTSAIVEAYVCFFAMLLGAGIGGMIGGIGGAVLGAGLAAKSSTTLPEARLSREDSKPTGLPEPQTELPEAELARLKERITELEAKKRSNDRFKKK
jgi:hypothetical protein